jgi:phosphomethylpyrimidine synthase
MCGHDWCSVRISKEIVEFASGKHDGFERDGVSKSPALTSEQREILERRGVLSAEEIERLASKTRKAVGAAQGNKASCHSDHVDANHAQRIQEEQLVELRRNSPTAGSAKLVPLK